MKKLLLFFVVMFSLFSLNSIATEPSTDRVIDIKKMEDQSSKPRSVSAQAKAWIDNSSTLLTVQVLYAQGGVDVMLTDARGQIVHQDSAVADGSKQRLMLPALDAGTYYLTISCNGTEWDGELYL